MAVSSVSVVCRSFERDIVISCSLPSNATSERPLRWPSQASLPAKKLGKPILWLVMAVNSWADFPAPRFKLPDTLCRNKTKHQGRSWSDCRKRYLEASRKRSSRRSLCVKVMSAETPVNMSKMCPIWFGFKAGLFKGVSHFSLGVSHFSLHCNFLL